jgi:hypothetical protein
MDARSDAALDELAAETIGWPGRPMVLADPIVEHETPRESGGGVAKLAATLIVAGSWCYGARFRGTSSRPVGRPGYRKESE